MHPQFFVPVSRQHSWPVSLVTPRKIGQGLSNFHGVCVHPLSHSAVAMSPNVVYLVIVEEYGRRLSRDRSRSPSAAHGCHGNRHRGLIKLIVVDSGRVAMEISLRNSHGPSLAQNVVDPERGGNAGGHLVSG